MKAGPGDGEEEERNEPGKVKVIQPGNALATPRGLDKSRCMHLPLSHLSGMFPSRGKLEAEH